MTDLTNKIEGVLCTWSCLYGNRCACERAVTVVKVVEDHYAALVSAANRVRVALRDDELATVLDERAALDDLVAALDALPAEDPSDGQD